MGNSEPDVSVSILRGQPRVVAWFVGVGITLAVLLAGGWAHSFRAAVLSVIEKNEEAILIHRNAMQTLVAKNEKTIETHNKEIVSNSKRIERYDVMIKEQDRRLKRIESDVKEIKRGQSEIIRKFDQYIIERRGQ